MKIKNRSPELLRPLFKGECVEIAYKLPEVPILEPEDNSGMVLSMTDNRQKIVITSDQDALLRNCERQLLFVGSAKQSSFR